MTENNDITPELKSAIGQAYVMAMGGDVHDMMKYTKSLYILLGTGAQIRKDRRCSELIVKAREHYREAEEFYKQEHTMLDAVDILSGILISLGPLIFDDENPYGKININQFNPQSVSAGEK